MNCTRYSSAVVILAWLCLIRGGTSIPGASGAFPHASLPGGGGDPTRRHSLEHLQSGDRLQGSVLAQVDMFSTFGEQGGGFRALAESIRRTPFRLVIRNDAAPDSESAVPWAKTLTFSQVPPTYLAKVVPSDEPPAEVHP